MHETIRRWKTLAQERLSVRWEPALRAMAEDAARATVHAAVCRAPLYRALGLRHGSWRKAPFEALLACKPDGDAHAPGEGLFRDALRLHGLDAAAVLLDDLPAEYRAELHTQTQGLHDYLTTSSPSALRAAA